MSCIKFPGSKSDHSQKNDFNHDGDQQVYKQLVKLANELFGDENWSHSVTSQNLDFIEYVHGKYQAGCVSVVRVQRLDGTFHEDIGYSSTECSMKGQAIYNARTVSVTNALKKALSCFGNSFIEAIDNLTHESSLVTKTTQLKNPQPIPKLDTKIPDFPLSQSDKLLEQIDFDETFDHEKHKKEEKEKVVLPEIKKKKLDVSADTTAVSINTVKEKISTAMTEEEMRLERKRKQRELQEEFKKKHQNGIPTPNPRF